MFRNVCILLSALFLFLAAFVVSEITVGDHKVSWLYLGLAFWSLSFLVLDNFSHKGRAS